MNTWHFKAGELSSEGLTVHVDPNNAPVTSWRYTGLRVADASEGIVIPADSNERLILIAAGTTVTVDYVLSDGTQNQVILNGRISVFHGPSDVLYLPINSSITIKGTARVLIGEAPTSIFKSAVVIRKEDVSVVMRGAGAESRQIHNVCMPNTLDADRLICVEGIVPAGNWSGVPAHKHDTYIPGKESHLEEIYYFEMATTRTAQSMTNSEPFGFFRGYASDEREFHVDATIHSGDVVLVPHGYHGPVAAAPGYDLYFFNVMAGPDEKREWLVTDDPAHAWIRQTWDTKDVDPRLPYGERQEMEVETNEY